LCQRTVMRILRPCSPRAGRISSTGCLQGVRLDSTNAKKRPKLRPPDGVESLEARSSCTTSPPISEVEHASA
jgi:hypothetical protein